MTALIDVQNELITVDGLRLRTPGVNLPGLRYVTVLNNGTIKGETTAGSNALLPRFPAIDDALALYNSALATYQAEQEQLRQQAIVRQTREAQARAALLAEDFAQLKATIVAMQSGPSKVALTTIAKILHRLALAQGLTEQPES